MCIIQSSKMKKKNNKEGNLMILFENVLMDCGKMKKVRHSKFFIISSPQASNLSSKQQITLGAIHKRRHMVKKENKLRICVEEKIEKFQEKIMKTGKIKNAETHETSFMNIPWEF